MNRIHSARIALVLTLLLLLAACQAPTAPPQRQARPSPSPTVQAASSPLPPRGYITFAVNCHEWTQPEASAATVERLIELFERYGVRGDFYLTAPLVHAYEEEAPQIIARLRDSGMTISYHVRPPHPLCKGFDRALTGLDAEARYRLLWDYEHNRLDLRTGGLDRSQAGGYTYVAQCFGRLPVVASVASAHPQNRATAERLFADLGARMTVHYHTGGSDPDRPFVVQNGLLIRPSDFGVVEVSRPDGTTASWWDCVAEDREHCSPLPQMMEQLEAWEASGHERLPFITMPIHENDFFEQEVGWGAIYYCETEGEKSRPCTPPYDLTNVPHTPRSQAEEEAIWSAYEALVAYAAQELEVVTSEDVVRMAEEAGALR